MTDDRDPSKRPRAADYMRQSDKPNGCPKCRGQLMITRAGVRQCAHCGYPRPRQGDRHA